MIEFILKGGYVMIPIIALGLVAVGIIVERGLFFYFTSVNYSRFIEVLFVKIRSGELKKITLYREEEKTGEEKRSFRKRIRSWIDLQKWNRNPYIKVAMTYIRNIEKGNRSREEALRRVGSEEIERMEKNFKGLSAISHVSPLLGLLGTVTGIIGAFSVISELGGQVDVTALAGGIWEAMLTTAAGLVVAIPAQLAFLYFEKLVDSRANRMSYVITHLNEELFSKGGESSFSRPELDEDPACGSDLISHDQTHREGIEGL